MPGGRRQALRVAALVEDEPVDEGDDEHWPVGDRRVLAQPVHDGKGDVAPLQRGEYPVLPGHVVGRGEQLAHRGAPQDRAGPLRVGDEVGEVGLAQPHPARRPAVARRRPAG
uniref:Uncharacterized protein n=1 Tax=Janibacter limosus TaxID=53458 RepID=A0AC61U5R8_9MICO|nr:hypothetical protein [Janibacter limosus]